MAASTRHHARGARAMSRQTLARMRIKLPISAARFLALFGAFVQDAAASRPTSDMLYASTDL
jgi:hypothetical protein